MSRINTTVQGYNVLKIVVSNSFERYDLSWSMWRALYSVIFYCRVIITSRFFPLSVLKLNIPPVNVNLCKLSPTVSPSLSPVLHFVKAAIRVDSYLTHNSVCKAIERVIFFKYYFFSLVFCNMLLLLSLHNVRMLFICYCVALFQCKVEFCI